MVEEEDISQTQASARGIMTFQQIDPCAFCHEYKENSKTGELQRSPDGKIVAHYNCMLYSPMVVSINSQEDVEGFDFDIKSVLCEINRGRKLKCSFCKKRGATAGCHDKSCRKTYHYPCVEKDKGSPSKDRFNVYCAKHTMKKSTNGSQQKPTIKMASPQENQNDAMTTEDALNTGVTDTLRCLDNDGDKTLERQPGISVKGIPSEQLKSIVPQVGNYVLEPLDNQEGSDDSIKEIDPVCQERSESIASKRKRSEDFEELLPNMKHQQTEGNLTEQLEIPGELDEYNCRENATPGSVESEHAAEHQYGSSRMTTPRRRQLYGSFQRNGRQSDFQHERVGDLDGIDGFGRVIAGQCRSMPQDRQAKYMSYILGAADLFHAPPILPDIDILLINLRTVLMGSQQSSPSSARSSSV